MSFNMKGTIEMELRDWVVLGRCYGGVLDEHIIPPMVRVYTL